MNGLKQNVTVQSFLFYFHRFDVVSIALHCTYLFSDEQSFLRIDNSGWGVNSSPLFDVAGKRWYQSKYHVLYTIRQPIINSIY